MILGAKLLNKNEKQSIFCVSTCFSELFLPIILTLNKYSTQSANIQQEALYKRIDKTNLTHDRNTMKHIELKILSIIL